MPARLTTPTTTPDDIERIAAVTDPVIRNLQITQSYHEMALAMRALTGAGANWCAVATWASKQAGQSIRKEDLVRNLENRLVGLAGAEGPFSELPPPGPKIAGAPGSNIAATLTVLREALNPAAVFQRTSEAVAQGNKKVFEEIGLLFARFLSLFNSGKLDEPQFSEFLDGLLPGEPPHGQRYLRQAFTHYAVALNEEDVKAGAEWMLLANLEIGFHEQTRLQPEIVAALNAPVYDPKDLRQQVLEALVPDELSRLRLTIYKIAGQVQPALVARDALSERMQQAGHKVITEHMMSLRLGGNQVLWLGQDVRAEFPDLLRKIANTELVYLLAQVDPTPDSVYGSGAEDWGRLSDRMHFISDLFRAFHFDPLLFNPPFTSEQVTVLKRTGLPQGRL